MSKPKCKICEAMEEAFFPFVKLGGVVYLDSEDQIEGGLQEVHYCLACGRKLPDESA